MKNLMLALVLPAICLTLAAETSGRINFTVKTSAGVPIKDAKVQMDRVGITWSKSLLTNDKGVVVQVGLEPKDFNFTVTAPGYQPVTFMEKVPLAEVLTKTITLLTPEEARHAAKASGQPVAADPNEAKEAAGSEAYNQAIALYKEQKFDEALPLMEVAVTNLQQAAANMKDPDGKAKLEANLPMVERVYGLVLAEVGKTDPAKATKAEPILLKALERNPKDQNVVAALLQVAAAKQDTAMTEKYQAVMDALIGPRPELAYNEAVAKQTAGDNEGAKKALLKAIKIDPKFTDSYYLMGVVEYGLGNFKAAKESLKKYLVVAPSGKHVQDVKDFLKELPK